MKSVTKLWVSLMLKSLEKKINLFVTCLSECSGGVVLVDELYHSDESPSDNDWLAEDGVSGVASHLVHLGVEPRVVVDIRDVERLPSLGHEACDAFPHGKPDRVASLTPAAN